MSEEYSSRVPVSCAATPSCLSLGAVGIGRSLLEGVDVVAVVVSADPGSSGKPVEWRPDGNNRLVIGARGANSADMIKTVTTVRSRYLDNSVSSDAVSNWCNNNSSSSNGELQAEKPICTGHRLQQSGMPSVQASKPKRRITSRGGGGSLTQSYGNL